MIGRGRGSYRLTRSAFEVKRADGRVERYIVQGGWPWERWLSRIRLRINNWRTRRRIARNG